MTEPESRYDRGHLDGQTAAQLAEHALHLQKLNGSLAEMVSQNAEFLRKLDKILASEVERDKTTVTVANALDKQNIERREATETKRLESERTWFPWGKAFVIGGFILAAAMVYLAWTHGQIGVNP